MNAKVKRNLNAQNEKLTAATWNGRSNVPQYPTFGGSMTSLTVRTQSNPSLLDTGEMSYFVSFTLYPGVTIELKVDSYATVKEIKTRLLQEASSTCKRLVTERLLKKKKSKALLKPLSRYSLVVAGIDYPLINENLAIYPFFFLKKYSKSKFRKLIF
jgi:hypothetical protein